MRTESSEFSDAMHTREITEEKANALIEELNQRCNKANIAIRDMSQLFSVTDEPVLSLAMPCARDARAIHVEGYAEIAKILSHPFEDFVFLNKLAAICNYKTKTIEAGIVAHGLHNIMLRKRLFGLLHHETDVDGFETITIHTNQEGLPSIEISRPSRFFMLVAKQQAFRSVLSIKLKGCNITSHDDAKALLKSIAEPLFFQIDMITGNLLTLNRPAKNGANKPHSRQPTGDLTKLNYPTSKPHSGPLSLYANAKNASGFPLLQFLSYYQVLEYYYPLYTDLEVQKKIKLLLADPAFQSNSTDDISRLISIMHSSKDLSIRNERVQLETTLSNCVIPEKLDDFLNSDNSLKDFLTSSKAGGSIAPPLTFSKGSQSLISQIAQRIYSLRCRIVHTKSDASDDYSKPLLPFSKEADKLEADIAVVGFLARSVLIANNRPINWTS